MQRKEFGKEQVKMLQTIHEGISQKFAAGLSEMLRTPISVKPASVDSLRHDEFIFSLDNPTCFNLVQAGLLGDKMILDIPLSIMYPIINRLLGGNHHGWTLWPHHKLTDIECRLVSRITNLFLAELKNAWKGIMELNFSVVQIESNPQLIQNIPPNETVILLGFEVALIECRGIISLCIPYGVFEQITAYTGPNT